MQNYLGKKVLATTSAWFFAPDGKQYRAVWGTLKAVHSAKEELGFSPSARHTNWMAEIGDTLIAGCQLLYFVRCDEKPDFKEVEHTLYDMANGVKAFQRPNEIYIAE